MLGTVSDYTRSAACLLLVGVLAAACTETQQVQEEFEAADAPEESTRDEEEQSVSAGDLELIAAETVDLIRSIRGETPAGEVVDFEQLFRIVPKKLADLPRVSREGQTNQIGIGLSGVEAVYEDRGESLTLEIYDLAPYSNLSDLLFTEWTRGEIDRQTHQGYEKTRSYLHDDNSWPAYEQIHFEDDRVNCQITVWVNRRFLVSIDGEGSDEDLCKEAASDISVGRLERLAAREP